MTKAEARQNFLFDRRQISQPEIEELSAEICSRIFSHFNFRNKHVLLFSPIRKNKEVNLSGLADQIRKSGGHTYLPISDFENLSMEIAPYFGDEELTENKWGIPEPKVDEFINAEIIDIVILPLTAFDRDGHRAGYGKGFYDRFLTKVRPDCIKAGVNFFEPIARFQDLDPFDVAMDLCFTHERMYSFKPF